MNPVPENLGWPASRASALDCANPLALFIRLEDAKAAADWRIHKAASTSPPSLGSSTLPLLSADDWLSAIKDHESRGEAHNIELCRLVCLARRTLKHGAWTNLWKSKKAPFSKSKADKMARVGDWLEQLNAHTCEHLPAGWQILHTLSRLSPAMIIDLAAAGEITGDLTYKQAQQLVAKLLLSSQQPPRSSKPKTRAAHLCNFVRETVNCWTEEERRDVLSLLHETSLLIQAKHQKDNP